MQRGSYVSGQGRRFGLAEGGFSGRYAGVAPHGDEHSKKKQKELKKRGGSLQLAANRRVVCSYES